ncbi:MAG: NifU family protein [Bacteroidales bacterium]|nr:NifU family protein [Bacteroidales bacterium]
MSNNQISIAELENVLQPVSNHVRQDGGDLKIIELTPQNVLRVELLNACANCKLSKLLFKEGMLKIIQKRIPEIQNIEIINE